MSRGEFEGQEVVAVECKVAGTIGDGRLNRPLAPGDRVVVVCVAVVAHVDHADTASGLERVQALKATEGFVLADEADADDLVHKLRADRRRELDELLGRAELDGMGDA